MNFQFEFDGNGAIYQANEALSCIILAVMLIAATYTMEMLEQPTNLHCSNIYTIHNAYVYINSTWTHTQVHYNPVSLRLLCCVVCCVGFSGWSAFAQCFLRIEWCLRHNVWAL